MANSVELLNQKDFMTTLLEAQDYFMYGEASKPGIGLDFLSNREAFINAIRTLHLDLLLEETPPAIAVVGAKVKCSPSFTMDLSPASLDIQRQPLVTALDMSLAAALTLRNPDVSSRIFIAHKLDEETANVTKPAIELSSEWHAPALLSDYDTKSPIDEVIEGRLDERGRLQRLAQLLASGDYDLTPPSQTYAIKIGQPVVRLVDEISGVKIDQWYGASAAEVAGTTRAE